MDITFQCSKCGQRIEVDEAGAGMKVPCPNCKTEIIIPSASKQSPPKRDWAMIVFSVGAVCFVLLVVGILVYEKKHSEQTEREKVNQSNKATPSPTNAIVNAPTPEPAPPKEVPAGSLAYLDFKNGFRDVTFGQERSTISGLTTIHEDKSDKSENCKREADELSLNNVPLKEITYGFFDGKLFEIWIKWEIEEKAYDAFPMPTYLSNFCQSLYGEPTSRKYGKITPFGDGKKLEVEWVGRTVSLKFSETYSGGVAPYDGTGGLLPKTHGYIWLKNNALSRQLNDFYKQLNANEAKSKRDGM